MRKAGPDTCPACTLHGGRVKDSRVHDTLAHGIPAKTGASFPRPEWTSTLAPLLQGLPYRIRRYECSACAHRWSSLEFRVPDLVTILPARVRGLVVQGAKP